MKKKKSSVPDLMKLHGQHAFGARSGWLYTMGQLFAIGLDGLFCLLRGVSGWSMIGFC